MKILVLIKQVPDDVVKVELGADQKPAVGSIAKIVNAMDTYAIEMAVREVEANGGEVVVATLGDPDEVRPALVQEISVGAGKAYCGRMDTSAKDAYALATDLKYFVRDIEKAEGAPFDLVLCGKESTDEISSQVGAILAEKLETGFLSSVIGFEKKGDVLEVKQQTEFGYNLFETKLPATLTIEKPEYDPRYPTLKSKMKARKAEIPVLELGAGREAKTILLSYGEPPKREAGIRIQEKEAAVAVEKAMAILGENRLI